MTYSSSINEIDLTRARAAAYGLISHGFHYPERETISTITNPDRWVDWPSVLQKADGRISNSLQHLQDSVIALTNCSDSARRELQYRYDDLFGHAVRGNCPAYEMEYGRNEIIRQASDLADLAGFYRAFGMDIADDANGRPDHVTVESEFLSVLCSKQTYALTQGDKLNAQICIDAERTFLRDHLARWLPAFARHVEEADASGLFSAFARFADAFVKSECSYFDVHAGPATLELRAPDPVLDTQISCGSTGCGDDEKGEQFVQLGGLGMADNEK